MAIPTGYIFQSGTCLKSEIYQLIIDRLVAAGWTDVSGNPATDFVVLKSTGNTEDKELILNIRPTNASNANSVVTTDYCAMSYRLQDTYTPGEAGVAGTFGRSSLAWTALYVAPVASLTTALGADTEVNYHVYADASKIILVLEYPAPTGLGPQVIYMGLPDSLLVSDSANRGMLVGASAYGIATSSVQICNTSDGVASVTAPYNLTTYSLLPPGDPNARNKRMISSVYYGSAAESYRGKLDGIKCMLYTSVNTGDTVTIGAETYRVLVTHSISYTSFPSRALLIRTA
ncbi:hypothetical protein HSX37_16095|uniref:Uncharacterized protein n=1 Tax=Dendrosporobacter quercicolus TaxID=146817 RepID=A0A1G9ZMR7_9FIRM|nr:hypothetical protein [Dendrosporobacter quercicolus]NSL49557.1 hypothetical protein [Dendrosporobacter quercicolus DSM 1736]SDN22638.1 hypothetical protein SAMN04488502_11512 [Dendrosporobacter quercicolus]